VLSLTRLLGAPPTSAPDLRYDPGAPATRTGALPGSGPVVVWNWTRRCNLACRHCYASAVRGPSPGELSTAEARALLADLATLRVPALLVSGGEPLMRPDAFELLAQASRLGLRCTVSTNGTLIDEDAARRLAAAGVTYVGVSLDGPPEVHDRWRAQRGAHAASLRGIRLLRAAGVRVGLRFTLRREALRHVPYILQLAEAEGISRVCFYHLVPAGRAATQDALVPERAEVRACLADLLERSLDHVHRGTGMEILTVGNHSDGPFAYLWLRRHLPERAEAARVLLRRNGGNRAGVAMVCVGPRGDVHPDQFSWRVRLGNVRETPLSVLWQGGPAAPLLDELRGPRQGRIGGRCGACAWFSLCNGNLRARAAAAGDFWGPDPACVLEDHEVRAGPPGDPVVAAVIPPAGPPPAVHLPEGSGG
jgi:radical SAM protein with 4Fe4S-binding SPASM domain